jgi:hypothetical protein
MFVNYLTIPHIPKINIAIIAALHTPLPRWVKTGCYRSAISPSGSLKTADITKSDEVRRTPRAVTSLVVSNMRRREDTERSCRTSRKTGRYGIIRPL